MTSEERHCHDPSPPASGHCDAPPPILLYEVIVEILSWLPVKSLLQFRCVCKSWKSLISDRKFVQLHLHRSTMKSNFTSLRLLSHSQDYRRLRSRIGSYSVAYLLENSSSAIAADLCYPALKRYFEYYSVVGSCNGLLCFAGYSFGVTEGEYFVHIWNPATRLQSPLYIECPPCSYGGDHIPYFGFGYVHVSGIYKVVIVLVDVYSSAKEDSQKTVVYVCNTYDGRWRKIQNFPAVPVIPNYKQELSDESYAHFLGGDNDGQFLGGENDGQFLRGTLNWMAVNNISSGHSWNTVTINQFVIVSLDLGKETCKQLLLPHGLDEVPCFEPTLGVLMDCLSVSYDYNGTHFVVWQMEEFGNENSWTQLVNVSYLDFQPSCLNIRPPMIPICMSEAGNVLIVSNFDESRVIFYNLRDKRVEISKIDRKWIRPKAYVESLVLPI